MKQVILEAQAAAAAASAAAASSSAGIPNEDAHGDSHGLPPTLPVSALPTSPVKSSNSNSNKEVKLNPSSCSAISPPQQDIYFPAPQGALGDNVDEHGLAGFFFRVTLLSCSSLQGKNESGVSDPVVQLDYDGKVVFSTVCKSTNNPTWNECFNFNVSTKRPKLTFTVWHSPKFSLGSDTVGAFLGTACISDVSSCQGVVQNLMLQKKSSQSFIGGSICFQIDDPALRKPDVQHSKFRAKTRAVQVAPTWIQMDPPQNESWLEIFYDILVTSKQK